MNGKATLSPSLRGRRSESKLTPSPSEWTTPVNSCPNTRGLGFPVCWRRPSPRQPCNSDPQIIAPVFFMRIPPGSTSGVGYSRRSNGVPACVKTETRPLGIFVPLVLVMRLLRNKIQPLPKDWYRFPRHRPDWFGLMVASNPPRSTTTLVQCTSRFQYACTTLTGSALTMLKPSQTVRAENLSQVQRTGRSRTE